MELIDGKSISKEVCEQVAREVDRVKNDHSLTPGLAVVIVGEDPASQIYVKSKVRKAQELGLHSVRHELPETATLDDILNCVHELNADPTIHGILVQSPPPPGIDERKIVDAIRPDKDVDCFTPYNVGKLAIGDDDGFFPCTPHGIMVLLSRYGIDTEGKHAVILGRSNIVGRPMALLLLKKNSNSTVTVCHSRTQDLAAIVKTADIVIAAIGKAKFVTAEMVKSGAVVIDVGINRIPDPTAKRGSRLVGDVDFEAVSAKASYITPVPGGVGPMTIGLLMHNAVKACCLQNGITLPEPLY